MKNFLYGLLIAGLILAFLPSSIAAEDVKDDTETTIVTQTDPGGGGGGGR